MTEVKEILAAKKYPKWIKGHSIFKKYKKISKVFPEIGLPNSEKEIQLDNSNEVRQAAGLLIEAIRYEMNRRYLKLENWVAKKPEKVGIKRKAKLDTTRALLLKFQQSLTGECIVVNNSRVTLNLPTDITDHEGKVIFKAGEGLFRAYNKLNEILREGHFLAMEKVDNLTRFKEFSAKNIPALNYTLRFSSDGPEGLWDIATMSMRGISSCQTWGTSNASHIVGSMVDPFTGIIYLTSNVPVGDYGSKMIRRCVVRFVVSEKQTSASPKKQFIVLEKMYPALEQTALAKFIEFIRERTENKFDVKYAPDIYHAPYSSTQYYVPLAKIVKSLDPQDQPYRDSGMTYKHDPDDPFGVGKAKEQVTLTQLFRSMAAKVISSARSVKMGSVSDASKNPLRAMRGTSWAVGDYSAHIQNDLINALCDEFQKLNPINEDVSPETLQAMLDNFLQSNVEKLVFSKVKKSCNKLIPSYYGKIEDELLKTISKSASDKILRLVKSELKKLVKSKTEPDKPVIKKDIPVYIKHLN